MKQNDFNRHHFLSSLAQTMLFSDRLCCLGLFSQRAAVSVEETILPVLQNEAQMSLIHASQQSAYDPTGDGPVSKITPFQTVISFCKSVSMGQISTDS